jgi:hypothetical protein
MRFAAWKRIAVLALIAYSWLPASSQAPSTQVPTFRVDTHLVLVDVVAESAKNKLRTRALLTDLRREDFRIFDNGREMPIRSFDIGAYHETRPIALWLVVQCDNIGSPPEWHSGFLRGKTQLLSPALAHLEKDDAVGVAHWCDDGTASLDLPPGHDPDTALAMANRLISELPVQGENRPGELAMQRMVRMILDNVHHDTPERLPIFLYLYGDHSATFTDEANRIIEHVLETSGIVFGMSDNGYPFDAEQMFRNGKVFYLVHYYSHETGGQFYSTIDPRLFSAALDYILLQLHLRYTIGFKPLLVDGKRHTLKVELTKEAAKRFPGAEMRFRQEYIPVAAPSSAP